MDLTLWHTGTKILAQSCLPTVHFVQFGSLISFPHRMLLALVGITQILSSLARVCVPNQSKSPQPLLTNIVIVLNPLLASSWTTFPSLTYASCYSSTLSLMKNIQKQTVFQINSKSLDIILDSHPSFHFFPKAHSSLTNAKWQSSTLPFSDNPALFLSLKRIFHIIT